MKKYQIAIDGPVGAGKSTVAKRVAEKLNILYVDTGAMYRVVALHAKENKVDWHDEDKVVSLVAGVEVKLEKPKGDEKDGRNVTVYMNGKDVSWEIRKADLGEGASLVSQYREVRRKLVDLQRRMAEGENVIMEGRDIGTRVLPDADLKIYMDADIDERVVRKMNQLENMGARVDSEGTRLEVLTRDEREMTREIDPLRPAKNAWIFDTTGLSIARVVDRIVDRVAEL